jgi:hypothetical protein
MVKKSILAGMVAGLAISATAGAAVATDPVGKIARVTGTAVVSQGAQYVVATEGMAIREGDRLMAMEGGAITLQFADGCQLAVNDNEILTVGTADSCKSNSGQVMRPAALSGPVPPEPPPPMGMVGSTPGWVIPVVGAAVIGGAILIANNDDGDNDGPQPIPPSP